MEFVPEGHLVGEEEEENEKKESAGEDDKGGMTTSNISFLYLVLYAITGCEENKGGNT